MTEKYVFDYSKLRGRITEKCGNQKNFCRQMGISQSTLSNKFACVTYFSQPEIHRIKEFLDIAPEELSHYFFTRKV